MHIHMVVTTQRQQHCLMPWLMEYQDPQGCCANVVVTQDRLPYCRGLNDNKCYGAIFLIGL